MWYHLGDELRLDDDTHRPVEGLDLVEDRGRGALSEGDQPRRAHAHAVARGRHPFHGAAQDPGAEVELSLVPEELSVAQVEGSSSTSNRMILPLVTLTSV